MVVPTNGPHPRVDELELKKYHFWDDYEDDNIKRFHFFEDNKGNKEVHIDFSPYYYPTEAELDAVRKFVDVTGRIPDRMDNNNFNFRNGERSVTPRQLHPERSKLRNFSRRLTVENPLRTRPEQEIVRSRRLESSRTS